MSEWGWSAPVCPVTGELLGSGEFVSRSAVNRLVTQVSDLPELMGDLDYAVAGLRHGDSGKAGSVPSSKEPLNLSLVLEVWELGELLFEWAQALTTFVMGPKYEVRRGDWCLIRQTFVVYRDRICGWVEAPALVEAVAFAVHRLERLASPADKRLCFVGRCAECSAELMAPSSAVEVECRECRSRFEVAEVRARMLEQAGDLALARPRAREVAQIISGLVIGEATVRKWSSRGRLQPVREAGGMRLYRPRDIAELAEAAARRGA